jgi:hypothetical protein
MAGAAAAVGRVVGHAVGCWGVDAALLILAGGGAAEAGFASRIFVGNRVCARRNCSIVRIADVSA